MIDYLEQAKKLLDSDPIGMRQIAATHALIAIAEELRGLNTAVKDLTADNVTASLNVFIAGTRHD